MEAAVAIVKQMKQPSLGELIKKLETWSRSCSLEIYASRFSGDGKEVLKTPIGEFLCLIALALETPRPFRVRERTIIAAAAKLLKEGDPPVDTRKILKYARDLSDQQAEKVVAVLNEPTATA